LNGPVPLKEPFEEVSTFPTTGRPEIDGSPVAFGGVSARAEPPAGISAAIARTPLTRNATRRGKWRVRLHVLFIVTPCEVLTSYYDAVRITKLGT
jgi:hypothetical protein